MHPESKRKRMKPVEKPAEPKPAQESINNAIRCLMVTAQIVDLLRPFGVFRRDRILRNVLNFYGLRL